MYRVTKTLSGVYAFKFDDIHKEIINIGEMVYQGEGVLLVDDLETAAEIFGVKVSEIQVVND